MRIKGVNGYVLVKRVEEQGALGKTSLSDIFAEIHQKVTVSEHSLKQGQKVIIDASERTIIDGYVLVKVEDIKGVVLDD